MHDETSLWLDEEIKEEGVSRREWLDIMAMGGLATLAGSMILPTLANASDDEVVRIGYLPITDATALLIAHANGYFKDEGLEAAKPTLIRGWSPLIEGFVSNKFNLVHFLKPIPIWMRYNNKFPVKLMAWAHTNGSALVVGKDTGIDDFSKLGGKQVAVPYWYSMHNIVLQYALRKSGVTPVIKPQGADLKSNECNLQVMPPPDMPPALAAKKIDAFIVAEPFNALGELKAGAKMLRFTGDIWQNHPCCTICMNENMVNKKPKWTQAVMNALVRGMNFAMNDKSETAKILSRDGKKYLPMPAPVVKRAMTLYDPKQYSSPNAIQHPEWGSGRIDFMGWPYPSATKLIVDAMNETVVGGDKTFLKGLSPDFVADDLVNYTFIKNSLEKFPEWKNHPSVDKASPYERSEVLKL